MADRHTQVPIEAQTLRVNALNRACLLAVADQRVFVIEQAGPQSACVRYDCTDLLGGTRPAMATADIRPTVKRLRRKAT